MPTPFSWGGVPPGGMTVRSRGFTPRGGSGLGSFARFHSACWPPATGCRVGLHDFTPRGRHEGPGEGGGSAPSPGCAQAGRGPVLGSHPFGLWGAEGPPRDGGPFSDRCAKKVKLFLAPETRERPEEGEFPLKNKGFTKSMGLALLEASS